MTAGFVTDWRGLFGATPPLGYRLRAAHPGWWTRFHALPGSQRYAENSVQMRVILGRANDLGAACFAPDAPLWLVRGTAEDARSAVAEQVRWQPGAFDALFAEVADDRLRALWFSPARGRVLAPYDGGFDVFDRDADWRAALERQHRDWMSAREDRL